MKNFKIIASIAFLCAIITANISLSGNNGKLSNIKLNGLFSNAMADGETGEGNEVNCYSACSISLLYQFYDCGDCCAMISKPQGESSKCNHIADNC